VNGESDSVSPVIEFGLGPVSRQVGDKDRTKPSATPSRRVALTLNTSSPRRGKQDRRAIKAVVWSLLDVDTQLKELPLLAGEGWGEGSLFQCVLTQASRRGTKRELKLSSHEFPSSEGVEVNFRVGKNPFPALRQSSRSGMNLGFSRDRCTARQPCKSLNYLKKRFFTIHPVLAIRLTIDLIVLSLLSVCAGGAPAFGRCVADYQVVTDNR